MNPIELCKEIEERYRRYLETTFYFKDPDLRKSFKKELESGHLSQGPYLEATPVFKREKTPRELFEDILDFQPDEGFFKSLLNSPLYLHQEEAIKKALAGQNIVVATGTGSGKTEAFLYPILLHLYKEFKEGKLGPGVRALILYPMNALANDQRERLRDICKRLKDEDSEFRFTFGQYIGETPENENDRYARDKLSERQQNDFCVSENGDVIHGELIFRDEMRKTPPHILLTNYSMLEYLLIRPDDSQLFDNDRARWWKYIVLDEAHQYRGSRGIEMAMLLRRLKSRLREGGRSDSFCCITTSATLVREKEDSAAVAKFASELFDEPFKEDTVILGDIEPIREYGDIKLESDDYQNIINILNSKYEDTNIRLVEIAKKYGVQLQARLYLENTVGELLIHDSRASELRRIINGKPEEVQKLADIIFNDIPVTDRIAALSNLVQILIQARLDRITNAPLFSARYHLFFRSLEGAFVSYWPEKRVFLERGAGDSKYKAFEIALCRECGQHYFVGHKYSTRMHQLGEAIRDPSHDDFGASFFRPIENGWDEEDESNNNYSKDEYQLCVQCGAIEQGKTTCGHDNSISVIKEDSPTDVDRADQIARCGVCDYNAAGHDPVREVVHGTDGPHAVIATTLFQNLPENRKKILAFADSRQQAAFFAWYLEDSYRDILNRNLLLKVVQELSSYTPDGLSFRELSIGMRNCYKKNKVFSPTTGDLELIQKAWRSIYREFLTDEQRISLEGVGLVEWLINWPDWFEISEMLLNPPWSLTKKEASDLMLTLFKFMRNNRAVEFQTDNLISLTWDDLNIRGTQTRYKIGKPGTKYGVISWDGKNGKGAQFLVKLLKIRGIPDEEALDIAVNALRKIWEEIKKYDDKAPSSKDKLLIHVDDARRLNPAWWRLRSLSKSDTIYQCDTCGRLQTTFVQGVCQRHRCKGTLKEINITDLPVNHYSYLYETELPGSIRVEEHTAQLNKEKAREFQREFKNGKINVLSSSTTFELGVDLGNLDVIFLRNVPPEAFNYTQRVGRAGRRSAHPGLAITYCRRSPHDLYHFSRPERMLNGKIRPPALSLRNEKIIIRHITATVLSAFFRKFPERFKKVVNLFTDLTNPSGVNDFYNFIESHRKELEQILKSIVPLSMFTEVGLNDGRWINKISKKEDLGENNNEGESKLSLAEAEISSDYTLVLKVEKESGELRDHRTAEWAKRRADTIASEDVLSFLSRKVVIPKYGFPVDVVELDTQRTGTYEHFEILLQRDLSIAISEFAPTSKLVANKKLWESHGLKKVAEKEWPRKLYKKCNRHNVYIQWRRGDPEPPTPCGCYRHPFEYIIPSFGFTTDQNKPKEPTYRPERVFSTRPYFTDFLNSNQDVINIPLHSPLISLRRVSRGRMTVLCEGKKGRGFYICRICGTGLSSLEKTHRTSFGRKCDGTLEQVSLGHEFETDVLKLNFHQKSEEEPDLIWFAYSLAYALVEGAAEILEVPSTDLSATVMFERDSPIPPIILYDNVPGGAGLVARLEENEILLATLKAALNRVDGNCGCNEETSCYGCLRSYRNQFAHQHLQRGPVKRYLENIISQLT
jgi:superfamily II DNA/RNA helicase